jgi:amidase
MRDAIYATVTSLAQAIRAGEFSSTDVVEAHLRRIDEVNPVLNAVVQGAPEAAIAEARAADEDAARGNWRGPLHGVPMTIKDSFETAGLISSAGTKGRADYVPERDATVVSRLRSAGAILLGKTNTPEITLRFITDNFVYGQTNNPFDPGRIPGGSSGGAAAIVAAGGSAFDIGTDTGGSIRIPAHFCGICGLKPTAGRVPRTGHIPGLELAACAALTQVGPLARSVEDLGVLLAILAGVDWEDPAVVPMPAECAEPIEIAKLRIAIYTDNGITSPTLETEQAVRHACNELATAGAVIEEVRPPGVETSNQLWMSLMASDGGKAVTKYLEKLGTTEMHPFLDWTRQRDDLPTSDYVDTLAAWNRFRSDGIQFFERYDVIICPVNATPASKHGEPTPFNYTYTYNLLGWPVVVVRCGTSPEGLPIGVQVVARPWREDVALAVAGRLETMTGGFVEPDPSAWS